MRGCAVASPELGLEKRESILQVQEKPGSSPETVHSEWGWTGWRGGWELARHFWALRLHPGNLPFPKVRQDLVCGIQSLRWVSPRAGPEREEESTRMHLRI